MAIKRRLILLGAFFAALTMTTGCPSNFKIYMYGSSNTGASSTLSQGAVLDWSTFNITVETSTVSDHRTFQLLRNGSTYTSKSLSGSGNQTLFSGSLSDGMYELQYSCRYASSFLVDFTYYFYTFQFEVDKSAPTNSLKAGGSTIASGSYTNKQIVYTAVDENFSNIKCRKGKQCYKQNTMQSVSTSTLLKHIIYFNQAVKVQQYALITNKCIHYLLKYEYKYKKTKNHMHS